MIKRLQPSDFSNFIKLSIFIMAIVNNFSHKAKNENHIYQISGLKTHIEIGALTSLGLSTIYDYSDTLPPNQGRGPSQLVKQHINWSRLSYWHQCSCFKKYSALFRDHWKTNTSYFKKIYIRSDSSLFKNSMVELPSK